MLVRLNIYYFKKMRQMKKSRHYDSILDQVLQGVWQINDGLSSYHSSCGEECHPAPTSSGQWSITEVM